MKIKIIGLLVLMIQMSWGQEPVTEEVTMEKNLQVATLANGCFWCTETIFERLKGVKSVVSGYTGGTVKNPSYQEVVTGRTGHAEAIQLRFDPSIIGFADLLQVFFSTHDPTTLNRQGYDVGTQYRSGIFYHTEEQQDIAEAFIAALEDAELFKDPIVTEVTKFTGFYEAEAYHQDYYINNPNQRYCVAVIRPKLDKFLEVFKDQIKEE
jgi:peptide-methionine (S)-S-oxide reductase